MAGLCELSRRCGLQKLPLTRYVRHGWRGCEGADAVRIGAVVAVARVDDERELNMYRITNIERDGRAFTCRHAETKGGRLRAEEMFDACAADETVICAVWIDGTGAVVKTYNIGQPGVLDHA